MLSVTVTYFRHPHDAPIRPPRHTGNHNAKRKTPTLFNRAFRQDPMDYWSNSNGLYEREAQALGLVPETNEARLELRIETMTWKLNDIKQNLYYTMSNPEKKGRALLISNHSYPNGEDRIGTNVDFSNMAEMLKLLGYDTTVKIDVRGGEMRQISEDFAQSFNDANICNDSCIAVLMTHGVPGYFVGVDGEHTTEEDFFQPFLNAEGLFGKPKIFIVQACRGIRIKGDSEQPETFETVTAQSIREAGIAFLCKIPDASDICVFYSTTPGYYSWRNGNQKGSWFIHSLCASISKHAHEPGSDFATLAMNVRNEVSQNLPCIEGGRIQLAHLENRLTKKVSFLPWPNV